MSETFEDDGEYTKEMFSKRWAFSNPRPVFDEDGFSVGLHATSVDFRRIQEECWLKFNRNPQVHTSVRDRVGAVVGKGFGVSSEITEIQEVIDEITYDKRNRLWLKLPKFVARANIEGELFLAFTVHEDGFVEIDFKDPGTLYGGRKGSGIYSHPDKEGFPLAYRFRKKRTGKTYSEEVIPSINIAYFPELASLMGADDLGFDKKLLRDSQSSKRAFKKIGGFYRFIVAWDLGYLTERNVSYLRTVIEWINYYEGLKRYEIDHKKSSGAYAWAFAFEDAKAYRAYLSLSAEEKKETGIGADLTPGSRLVLPPGVKAHCVAPSLPKISDSDTDVLQMVTSGLNSPEDVVTGQSKGTYASVKASRGPMSDRQQQDIEDFDRFLRHEFWAAVFRLRSAVAKFPETFSVKQAVDFIEEGAPEKPVTDGKKKVTDDSSKDPAQESEKIKKPKFKTVKKRPEELIEINYPQSEVVDMAATVSAYLGVKHGSLSDQLGIPLSVVAKKLGFNNYAKLRLQQATEEARYPKLKAAVDQEAQQELAAAKVKGPNDPEQKAGEKPATDKKNQND